MVASKILADGEASAGWLDETTSRVIAAWKVAPPLTSVSGDDFACALLRCGWLFDDGDESEVRLERDGRRVTVPRVERLDPDVLSALAIEAKIGPLVLVAALERALIPTIERMLSRLRPRRPPA